MANTTFTGPVTSTNGFVGDIIVPTYTVANAPSASDAGAGTLVTFLTVLLAQLSWPSLMAQIGSVLIQVLQSQQRKELGYE